MGRATFYKKLSTRLSKGVLIKDGDFYNLSETSEYLLPYLSEKKAFLPVVLVYLGSNTSCLLYVRNKRPFKNKLSLPGGRIVMGESIPSAVERIMKDKFGINATYMRTNSISLEHVTGKNGVLHSFILILASASTKDKISLVNFNKHKKSIIKSDYELIKKDKNKRLNIKTLYSPN